MNPHRKLLALTLTVLAVTSLGFSAQAPACTVVASPTSDPDESGQLLLATLAEIEETPCLLRIEPGLYDLAGSTLVLRDQIDVEGSGRGVTTIRSTGAGAAPIIDGPAGVAAEIRDLSLLNQQQPADSYSWMHALNISSESLRVSRVDVEVDGALFGAGLFADGGRFEDVTIRIRLRSGSVQQIIGLYLCSPPNEAPKIRDVRIEFVDPVVEADYLLTYGIVVCGSLDVDRVEISMSSPSPNAHTTGIFVTSGSSVRVRNSTIHVAADTGSAVGVAHNGGSGEIRLSRSAITASGDASYGVTTGTDLTVEHSTIEATTSSILHFGATGARVGGSRLAQAVTGDGFICVSSYDGNFAPLSESCQ